MLLAACGGGAGGATPSAGASGATGSPAPGTQAQVTLHDVEVSPYAIWADELASRPITVRARATRLGEVEFRLSYFDGLAGGSGAHITRALYDDGTHGDTTAGDGVWTLTFVLGLSEPGHLRLYDGQIDRVQIAIHAVDANGDLVSPANAIDATVDVGVLSRSVQGAFPVRAVGADHLITDTLVNIVDPAFNGSTLAAVTGRLYEFFPQDPFDFAVIFHTRSTGDGIPRSLGVRNEVEGINLPRYDHSAAYGSAGRLQQVIHQNAHVIGLEINHEIGHRWGAYLDDPALDLTHGHGFHWGPSDHVGQMGNGPYLLQDSQDYCLVTNAEGSEDFTGNPFSHLELYLMGFATQAEVEPLRFVTDPTVAVEFGSHLPLTATRVVSIDDVVAVYGERVPSAAASQNDFTAAFIVVSDRPLSEVEYTLTSAIARYYAGTSTGGDGEGGLFALSDPPAFSAATGFRASLSSQLP